MLNNNEKEKIIKIFLQLQPFEHYFRNDCNCKIIS